MKINGEALNSVTQHWEEKYARNIGETKTNLIKLPKESDQKSNVTNKLEWTFEGKYNFTKGYK